MKKILLYTVIVSLLIIAVISIILKYKYENDFLVNQSAKLNNLVTSIDESSIEKKDEIGKITKDYKEHIYKYNIIIFLTSVISLFLIFKRKKILIKK